MTARFYQTTSRQALWSRRIALFAGQLFLLAALLHRVGSLPTTPTTYVLGLAISFAAIALLLAVLALVNIWGQGLKGAGRAIAGAIFSLLVLAGPLAYVPDLLMRPRINDIATDTETPPVYVVLAAQRPKDANAANYPGVDFATKQHRAYPRIRTMLLERSSTESHVLVREAVERLGWEIVAETKPAGDQPGHIEAVAKTLILGFADDVAIRVSAAQGESEIDARSASRYGQHDFGANARRITTLFREVKAGLEQGEKSALELALARRAQEAREIEKQEREKAKLLRAKARKEEEARQRALLVEERKRQEAQFRALQAVEQQVSLQSGLIPAPEATQSARKRRVRRRRGRWRQPADRFFQQFGG